MRTNILSPKQPEVKPTHVRLSLETERALNSFNSIKAVRELKEQKRKAELKMSEDAAVVGEAR